TGGWFDFLTGIVPGNIFGLQGSPDGSLSFNVLQLIVIAVAIGVAALKVGEPAEPFLGFVRSALAIVQKVLWWVILLAPIGTLGLIGNAVASYGWESPGSLGGFSRGVLSGPPARSASSPVRSTPASRSCCSSSTRCCSRPTVCRRCGTSPVPGPPSSWP